MLNRASPISKQLAAELETITNKQTNNDACEAHQTTAAATLEVMERKERCDEVLLPPGQLPESGWDVRC